MTSSSVDMLVEDQWILDPLFRTFPKLFIRDVLSMPPYPTAHTSTEFTGAFNYNNHPIINADVMGVIVKVHKREKCIIYDLDDGTGVVSCLCWLQSGPQGPHHGGRDADLPAELLQKLRQVTAVYEQLMEGFNLGDLLHVRGKIKVFHGVRELMCSYHAAEEDPNAETLRMVELVNCYRNFYDQPLKLPQNKDDKPFSIKTDSLRLLVETHLEAKQPERVSADDIQNIIKQEHGSMETVSDSTVGQVLRWLEEDGIVYKSPSKKDYHVTDSNVALRNVTLKILRKECKKYKYGEQGCPMVRVLEQLRFLLPYVHLQRSTVNRVLRTLEECSEVISLEPHHYQTMDD